MTDLLDAFAGAGVLAPADVHVARRLTALAGEDDPRLALAVALAVRGPRLGHVYVDLATVHETTVLEPDAGEDPPWPAPAAWIERVRASELVGGPLHLSGSALYLDRYWREERQIAADLIALRDRAVGEADADLLGRLFDDPRQRHAGETAARRRLTVLAGGPGTGKTTTVARIVALLLEHDPDLLVALAAPTGKAAARLVEAVQSEAAGLDVSEPTRERLRALDASTLHRLLGWRPGSHSRFRHDRGNRLPHDVVIVDETSMVSLSLMARLVEAVRPQARLVLVGDPGQLASIEAGAVLGDIVGTGDGPGIVTLDRVHRYGGAIAKVAEAIRRGDADGTLEALAGVGWTTDPEPVYERAVDAARAVAAAARADDARAAIDALAGFRILCPHRRDVAGWTERIERRLAPEGEWYPGRPLLVTENDYGLQLFNGDTGVVTAAGTAVFERRDELRTFSPGRLAAVETVYAMTVHKSQGSQYDVAAVVLPDADSPLLTRELLYTAVTRARRELVLVASEDSVRAAVQRPIARASGLGRRLRGG